VKSKDNHLLLLKRALTLIRSPEFIVQTFLNTPKEYDFDELMNEMGDEIIQLIWETTFKKFESGGKVILTGLFKDTIDKLLSRPMRYIYL
jgi:hypothetical protein